MSAEVYFEDVEVGTEIKTLVKHPDTRQLVMWAGASGDYYPLHYDKDFAQSKGLPGVIVHGQLIFCFLGQLITDWLGDEGVLKKISCRYRGMVFPNEDIICRGEVTRKYIEDDNHYVECRIWTENSGGEKAVQGSAIVILRSKKEI
jgi:acyl dehydratase